MPALPSLPPCPDEISPEAISLGSHSGQARPAEASANLRVSPLIAAALTSSTTTSTNQNFEMPVETEQLAPASATTLEHLCSSFTGGPASSPASSSEALHAEGGQTGAEGSGLSLQFTRSIGVLSAKSPLLKALTKRSQVHSRTSPQESPPHESPCDPVPDLSGKGRRKS